MQTHDMTNLIFYILGTLYNHNQPEENNIEKCNIVCLWKTSQFICVLKVSPILTKCLGMKVTNFHNRLETRFII